MLGHRLKSIQVSFKVISAKLVSLYWIICLHLHMIPIYCITSLWMICSGLHNHSSVQVVVFFFDFYAFCPSLRICMVAIKSLGKTFNIQVDFYVKTVFSEAIVLFLICYFWKLLAFAVLKGGEGGRFFTQRASQVLSSHTMKLTVCMRIAVHFPLCCDEKWRTASPLLISLLNCYTVWIILVSAHHI